LTVDSRQRVFIDRHAGSLEAVSFTDVFDITNALAGRLKVPAMAIASTAIGSVESYRRYRLLLAKAARELPRDETWFHPRTSRDVRQALEEARIARHRVRLYYGDAVTGLDAMELADTVGYVGRGGGVLQHPVLLAHPADRFGVRVHDPAVVRIALLDHCVDVWCHPQYHLPHLDFVPLLSGQARVVVDGRQDVDFDDDSAMKRYARFVRGEVHVSPIYSEATC
jgi:hypothetical protein